MVDPKGGKTQYFYDAQGNRKSVITPAPAPSLHVDI